MAIHQLENVNKETEVKEKAKPTKINHKYNRDKDREPVRGMFKYHEVEGGVLAFSIRIYKEDQVENYTLVDGQIYTIPLGVAKHLNKNGWYPIYEYFKGEPGIQNMGQNMRIGKKVRRYSFNSLEFVDIDDISPVGSGLLTVEKVG